MKLWAFDLLSISSSTFAKTQLLRSLGVEGLNQLIENANAIQKDESRDLFAGLFDSFNGKPSVLKIDRETFRNELIENLFLWNNCITEAPFDYDQAVKFDLRPDAATLSGLKSFALNSNKMAGYICSVNRHNWFFPRLAG